MLCCTSRSDRSGIANVWLIYMWSQFGFDDSNGAIILYKGINEQETYHCIVSVSGGNLCKARQHTHISTQARLLGEHIREIVSKCWLCQVTVMPKVRGRTSQCTGGVTANDKFVFLICVTLKKLYWTVIWFILFSDRAFVLNELATGGVKLQSFPDLIN